MNMQANMNRTRRLFLILLVSMWGIIGLAGCSSEPSAADQTKAFTDLAQHVFQEEANSQTIIGEVQQLIDQGKEKRNKILTFLETGSEVAKEAKENVERTAAPKELTDAKNEMIEALSKRLEGYRHLALYYDVQDPNDRTKGEALLKESYQIMDRVKKQIEGVAGN